MNKIKGTLLKIKQTFLYKKSFFIKVLRAGVVIFIAFTLVSVLMYVFLNQKYPTEIVLDGVFADESVFDISFSERDISAVYDVENSLTINCENGVFPKNEMVSEDEKTLYIRCSGTYVLSGSVNDGCIVIDCNDTDKIQLVFSDFKIASSFGPAIYVKEADKVFITTKSNTKNYVSDGYKYTYADGETNVDGAIFSKADITFNGNGCLVINGNNAHGIVSKDDLKICSGKIEINSTKKGICGKDCVKVLTGDVSIKAGTDGICSDNEESADKGYIYIKEGDFKIDCGNDGIQSVTALIMVNPQIEIITFGGSVNAPEKVRDKNRGKKEKEGIVESETSNMPSRKGIKSLGDIFIKGGKYSIDSCDDAIHADNSVRIENGSFSIKSGDDAIHCENTLYAKNGNVNIEHCFEGLEAYQILIENGEISIISLDDGVNASKDEAASNVVSEAFLRGSMGKLEIKGGVLKINSEGDSLDSNGVMSITGGIILISGPTEQGDSAVDCDGEKIIDGGILLCVGKKENVVENDVINSDFLKIQNDTCIFMNLSEISQRAEIIVKEGEKVLASFECLRNVNYVVFTYKEEEYNQKISVIINEVVVL